MIRIENLHKRFRRHDAIRGISFTVPEGSAYALIGANGAGKTTTLKILMNILQPTSGAVTLLGVDSRRITPRELNRIGYVSENQQMPERLTVDQYFAYLRPFYQRWDRQLEASLRAQLRLPASRRIGELSHGMRMKMALACALPFRPGVLILDEPFSGLDPLVRDEFMDGVLGQAGETTILISTHELGEIEGVATHVAFLEEGRLLFDEPMDQLRERFRAVRIVFDHPAPLPQQPPPDWFHLAAAGNTLEFIDAQFSARDSHQRLNARFHGIRSIDAEPVPLRTIFTSLARAVRSAA
ncbi:MAG TPA: ABC transporter ATP-binding protein [Terracidiphilus sp.]|nr:ABC transporter ATP-binding protein [Terracidiphilus sp.]